MTDVLALVADMLDPLWREGGAFWRCDRPICDGRPHEGFDYPHSRTEQRAPSLDWFIWFILAGRGFGKTRTGAEWLSEQMDLTPASYWALCSPTFDDARDVMVEGESGLQAVCELRQIRYRWNRSLGQFNLYNGARADVFSSEKPESWRGPNLTGAWGDEPATWCTPRSVQQYKQATACWQNLMLMTRKGRPHIVLTGTPRPTRFVRELVAKATVMTEGTTLDNKANLAPEFFKEVIEPLLGTRLGQQEVYGKLLDDVVGALWKLAQIDVVRRESFPEMRTKIVAVDPSASDSMEGTDECGIVVCGLDYRGNGWVLRDLSENLSVRGWANKVVNAYHDEECDLIVAEANNGGAMVRATLHGVDPSVPVELVNASRGKRTRAEPVAALYGNPDDPDSWEGTRVFHLAGLEELEDQMVNWVAGDDSPDRMDALVWGLTHLLLGVRRRGGLGS